MTELLAEGTTFAGRYRIVRRLAAGGMGAVYEVVHLETERRRALKVMHPYLFTSDDLRERFKREVRISAQVESEYIVDVSDAGVDDATQMPFMVMELLRGEDLSERLKRVGRRPSDEVVAYLHQVAFALDQTHARAIVHRDLKPQNLFLTRREDGSARIKILDFGIAKVVAEGTTAAGATQPLGTPMYMAPEQFGTGVKLSPATDIYALGMVAYTLLVGTAYWREEVRNAEGLAGFVMAALHGPQEPATRRAAARGVVLPPTFDAWFARATAEKPANRFRTASEAARALGEALGMAPVALLSPPNIALSRVGSEIQHAAPPAAGATTTTCTALTLVRGKRRATSALAAAAVLSMATLAMGGWLGLRTWRRDGVRPAPLAPDSASASHAALETTLGTSAPTHSAEPIPAVPASESARASPAAAVSGSSEVASAVPASTAAGAHPASAAGVPAKPGARGPAQNTTVKPQATTVPLFGRDHL